MKMIVFSAAFFFFFFFNDTATTEIYTLSLHDALPISPSGKWNRDRDSFPTRGCGIALLGHGVCRRDGDRKSTRLNSSHLVISYAVFCLKKKKTSLVLRARASHRPQLPVYLEASCRSMSWYFCVDVRMIL